MELSKDSVHDGLDSLSSLFFSTRKETYYHEPVSEYAIKYCTFRINLKYNYIDWIVQRSHRQKDLLVVPTVSEMRFYENKYNILLSTMAATLIASHSMFNVKQNIDVPYDNIYILDPEVFSIVSKDRLYEKLAVSKAQTFYLLGF